MKSPYEGLEKIRAAMRNRSYEPMMFGDRLQSVLIGAAFAEAKNSIKILSSTLRPTCYCGEWPQNAAKVFFCRPSNKMQILVESSALYEWEHHPFVEPLKKFMAEPDPQLEIRIVPPEWIAQYKHNFLLLDDYGYLYQEDRECSAGVASFNGNSNLDAIFERLWGVSMKYQPSSLQRPLANAQDVVPSGPVI